MPERPERELEKSDLCSTNPSPPTVGSSCAATNLLRSCSITAELTLLLWRCDINASSPFKFWITAKASIATNFTRDLLSSNAGAKSLTSCWKSNCCREKMDIETMTTFIISSLTRHDEFDNDLIKISRTGVGVMACIILIINFVAACRSTILLSPSMPTWCSISCSRKVLIGQPTLITSCSKISIVVSVIFKFESDIICIKNRISEPKCGNIPLTRSIWCANDLNSATALARTS